MVGASFDLRANSRRWYLHTRFGHLTMLAGAVLLAVLDLYALMLDLTQSWPFVRGVVTVGLPIPFVLLLYARARSLAPPPIEIRIDEQGIHLLRRSGALETVKWMGGGRRIVIRESAQDLWSDTVPTTRFRISRFFLPEVPVPPEAYLALLSAATARGWKVHTDPPTGFAAAGDASPPRNCVHYLGPSVAVAR